MVSVNRIVVLAPNWLGDAVMALPAIADVRRAMPGAVITVAARAAVAPLFALVPDVNDIIVLERRGWRTIGAELQSRELEAALLLPNSLHAAMAAYRGGIPERWGYRTDWRGRLLTRAIDPPRGLHQVEYYQQLVHALGFTNGPIEPRLVASVDARRAGEALLVDRGWERGAPLVAIAPGAAFGGAKRWPPESFASLSSALGDDGVRVVMVGSGADRPTAVEVLSAFRDRSGAAARAPIIDLVGQTDLATLAGVLVACRTLVTNDSGAMHLAAALGVAVTAVFGPTDDRVTRPLGPAHVVVTGPAWCRPCLLRECPLDHRCMRGIEVAPVVAAARRSL